MHETWLELLNQEFRKPYMQSLREFLIQEKLKNKVVYPPNEETFRALRLTGVDDVKVVILGQDPYHGRSQADGLAFSVQKGIKLPPSLRNIFKEIEDDLGVDSPKHGDLSFLAEQGVLLLNSVLTVNEGDPASHANRGWEAFTDKIVEILDHKKNIVFMLWGGYAQKKASKISKESHCILKATHPSPLSAHRGFFGCRHFSKANEYLVLNGLNPIKWTKP
ncbi:uracil-DNA glycosylase [Gammaproteobacteria bacterium]|nr:uracil-DNA glycosylase [Gammaproteobacteria bacterium]